MSSFLREKLDILFSKKGTDDSTQYDVETIIPYTLSLLLAHLQQQP